MATPSRTVHLRTPAEVIDAYSNWNCPHFSIINGKQLLIAYDNDDGDMQEGEQLLTQWVNILNSSGTAGIYTLCIYKNLAGKSIDNGTKYNGSVNFQFHQYAGYGNSPGLPAAGDPGIKLILDRMEAMQMQITRLQEETDTEEEDDTVEVLGKITGLLENPVIAGLIGQLFAPAGQPQIGQAKQAVPHNTEIGKVSRIAGVTDQEADTMMAEALRRLQAKVPDLGAVLMQLAKLAEGRPMQFKLYKATLMAMKL